MEFCEPYLISSTLHSGSQMIYAATTMLHTRLEPKVESPASSPAPAAAGPLSWS